MDDNLNLDSAPLETTATPSMGPVPRGLQRRGEGSSELRLTDYTKALYKRRWSALTILLVVVGVVTVNTFTATPIYQAKARLLIESGERNVLSFQQVVEEDQGNLDYYQTQYNILQSRALARKTIDALGLWDHALLGGAPAKPAFSLKRTLVSAPASAVSFVSGLFRSSAAATPPVATEADETMSQSRQIDVFLGALGVTQVRTSRLVDVTFRSPDPKLAADVVNALSKAYIEQNLEYKFMASKEAGTWLGERLAEQRKQVEAAETALQRYREQNDAISLEDRENIVVQKLTELNAAVTRAKIVRIEKEALFEQLRASQANPALLDTFPAILGNAFIQQQKGELAQLQRQHAQLSERLLPKHPDLIRMAGAIELSQSKLQAEIGKVVQSVGSEYRSALAQEKSLTAALNQQKNEALAMNRKAIDYSVLQRDVDSSKQIYDSLLQRTKETGVAGTLRSSNVRVVDGAERPRSPITPQKTRDLALAVVAGLVLACFVALFFEMLDSRIKTPDDIKAHLNLVNLGMLPAVSERSLQGRSLLVSNAVPVHFAEALKAIRTNVLFSATSERAQSVVVTSAGPGEGKSVVAANMALSLAQAGQRVLLVDADMRRPTAHTVVDVPQEPGLSNLLVGQAKASESVRRTEAPGLWVLPSGRIPPNPAELIGSRRFSDFISSLDAHFDWVIIDSPPVLAVTDACLIAHKTACVLFVVGAEMTSRHAARCAVEQLEQVNARFIGAVLNRVDLTRNPYYYSAYYRPEYATYYRQNPVEVATVREA